MTRINRPGNVFLALALVCILATGGCVSKQAGQETGTAEGLLNQTSTESSSETTETVSAGGMEEPYPAIKERPADPAKAVKGSKDDKRTIEAVSGTAETGNRMTQESLELQEAVLKGMVWTASVKRMVYNTADNSFVWWCLYGIAGAGAERGEEEITVKTENLEAYTSVLFEGKTVLPAIPESMAGFIVPDEKNNSVVFHMEDKIDGSFNFSEPERIDENHVKITGTWTTEKMTTEKTDPPAIQFYLVNRTGAEYPYTVQYMEMEGYICNDIVEGDRVFEP